MPLKSKLFTQFLESYGQPTKAQRSTSSVIDEKVAACQVPDKLPCNDVMIKVNGKKWKAMDITQAIKQVTRLRRSGAECKICYIQENQSFDINALIESDELTPELIELMDSIMEQEVQGDPDPEENEEAEDAGPMKKKSKKTEACNEEEEQGDPDPEELDDAEETGPKGKKMKVSEAMAKDIKDAIAGKCDTKADDVDDEEIADTEPDESKSATRVGVKGKKMKVSEAMAKDTKDAAHGKGDVKADDVDDEEIADTEPDESKAAAKMKVERMKMKKKKKMMEDTEISREDRVAAALDLLDLDARPDIIPDMDEPLFIDPTIRGEDDQAIGAELSKNAGRV